MSRSDWLSIGIVTGLIFGVVNGVIVGGLFYYDRQNQQKREYVAPHHAADSRNQDRQRCAKIRTLAEYQECLASEEGAKREEQRQQYDLEAQQDMSVWALGVLLLSAEGIIISFCGLIFLAYNLRATRWALDAADRSADAAESSALISRDTAHRQLRAYVGIDEAQGPDLEAGPPFRFRFFIKNAGQTPAHSVKHWTGFTLGPYPLTETLNPPSKPPRFAAIIFGGGRFKVEAEITQYSPAEVMRLREKGIRLYVFGEITYVDIYDEKQTTEFRLMYGGEDIPAGRGMIFCEEGNRAT